jgi:hypothetical protein
MEPPVTKPGTFGALALFTLMLAAITPLSADGAAEANAPSQANPVETPRDGEAEREQDDPDAEPKDEEEALDRVQQPFTELPGLPEPTADEGEIVDECDSDFESPHWQEDAQELFRGASCHSFRWFDGLFGESVDYPEETISGLVILGGSWNQYEGFDTRARFRVRAPLPNLDNRWNVIIGRGDDDSFISDTQTQDETFYNPGIVERGDNDSLLLGLGGRPRTGEKGWDWSAGVRLRTPPVPYVRLRWNFYKAFDPKTDLRFRQTFFWRSDDGFGVTARGDLAHAFRPQDVIRWEGVATHSETSPGTEWYVGQTWYHLMRDRHAFSVLAFATGETDGPVSMREAGFNFIWRQPFTRDWLWISYGPSATWPRFEPEDRRELSLGFSLWFEMEFGKWRY